MKSTNLLENRIHPNPNVKLKLSHHAVISSILALTAFVGLSGISQAALIFNFSESGGTVTISYSGSINTSGLTQEGLDSSVIAGIDPSWGNGGIYNNPTGASLRIYSGAAQTGSIGTGAYDDSGWIATGTPMWLSYDQTLILLPDTYISGTAISGSLSKAGTLAGFGINVSSDWGWSWGSGLTADFIAAGNPAYWTGDQGSSWSTNNASNTNWASDLSGSTDTGAIVNSSSDVIFSATGAANQNTTLGADFTINSLTINDTAAVTIGGANTLTIAGNNAITVNSGAGLFTINSNLTLSGTTPSIIVNNLAGMAVGGVIDGSTGLIKEGSGTLTLSGANTYTGTTTITAGTLALSSAGRLDSTSSLVINGGELTFVDSESVSSFTQTGGTINFDVTHPGGSPISNCQLVAGTDNDVLYVSGSTSFSGGTIHVIQGGANEFARGESAILIEGTPGNIYGVPSSFTDDFASRNFLVIDNENGLVTLLGSGVADGGSLADIVGLTANQIVVADAINDAISGNGDILDTSVSADYLATILIGDCDASPAAGLDLISPEVYAGFTDYGVEIIKSYTKAALNMPGFSKDGSARSVRIPVGTSSEPVVSGVSSESVTSVFAGYTHYSTGTDSSINGADYDIRSNGGIVGVRHDVNGLMIGGFLGVDEGDVNSSALNADSDAFLLGAIASYTIKPEMNLIVTGGITYGSYEFSGDRTIGLSSVSFVDVGSDVFDIHIGLEGDAYAANNLRVTPFVGFHYIYSDTEAFTETGVGGLSVDAHDYDAFFSEIGVKAEYQLTKQVSLNGNLSYTHNLSGSDKNIGASLGGTPFAVASPGLGNDFFTIGIGAQYQVTEDVRLGINYRAEFSTDAEVANGVNIGGSYSF